MWVQIATLYSLYTLLFSGFLANSNKLPASLTWLPYLSPLYYTFELVMSNEFLGQTVSVKPMWAHTDQQKIVPIQGEALVNQFLGFNNYSNLGYPIGCPWGGETLPSANNIQLSACWFDIYLPFAWFVGAVALSVVLLKYCVRESH